MRVIHHCYGKKKKKEKKLIRKKTLKFFIEADLTRLLICIADICFDEYFLFF